MSKAFADALKSGGIRPGDVIEISTRVHWTTEAIEAVENEGEEWKGIEPTVSEGLVFQVTAIGVESVLGYWLVGKPKTDQTYAGIEWQRRDRESQQFGATTFRKVGRRTGNSYVWYSPDLLNIYSRIAQVKGS